MDMIRYIWDEATEFLWEVIPFLLACLFILFIAVALIGTIMHYGDFDKPRQEFMAQCMADGKKEYECTYMWRSSRQDTVPVFIPMPIPTGR